MGKTHTSTKNDNEEIAAATAPLPSNFMTWKPDEVAKWVHQLDSSAFGSLVPIIKENAISGDVLPMLTSAELLELGVKKVGPRIRLLEAIKALSTTSRSEL